MLRFLLVLLIFKTLIFAKTLIPVTLQLAWKYQFQFAGYIMAKEKGFYQKAGLDVTLKEYELDMEVNREVLNGRAEFGIARSDIILDRLNEGMLFVQMFALAQASPVILQTLKRDDIKTLHDLKDKRFVLTGDGLKRDAAEIVSMLYSVGIKEEEIDKVSGTTYGPEDIINGNGDVITAYSTITPFHLKELGYEPYAFYPKDYGFDFYSDILFTMDEYIKRHPEIVSKFYEATLLGWEYAFEHIEETVDVIKSKYDTQELSKSLLLFEANELKKLAYMADIPLGDINPIKIEKIVNSFRFLNLTKNPLNDFQAFIYQHPLKETVKLPFNWNLLWKIVAGIAIFVFLLLLNQFYLTRYYRQLKYKKTLLEHSNQMLQEQAHKDALTKLFNRHYLMEAASQLIALAKRTEEPLCVMMLDIDNFKMINDTYGHTVGDCAIKEHARIIKQHIRQSDIAARFGGEEFVILLPNTSLEGAGHLGEKIREVVQNAKIPFDEHYIMMTVSIGISLINPEYYEHISEKFWQHADEALYEAKRTGKNKVVVWEKI